MDITHDLVITCTAREQAELLRKPVDARPLGADEVIGRTVVSLLSPGTELAGTYLGEKFPAEPGYAAVFAVDAVGSGVTDLRPGDLVLGKNVWGTGGHRLVQRNIRSELVPLPTGLSPEPAVHARLMAVCMGAMALCQARPSARVLILGLGPVGHLGAAAFTLAGYTVTTFDPSPQRRQMARDKQVATVVDTLDPALEVDLALDCSGVESAVLDAVGHTRKGGEVFMVGIPWSPRSSLSAFDLMQPVFRRNITLRGGSEWQLPKWPTEPGAPSVYGNFARCLDWFARGQVNVAGLYQMARPQDCQQVYQDVLHARTTALTVLFDWRPLWASR